MSKPDGLLTENRWDELKTQWEALSADEQDSVHYASYEDYCEETDNPIPEDDWDALHDDWGDVDTNSFSHERYDHYREEFMDGYYDGLASRDYEDAAYGQPDDPYYGPEYPTWGDRDD